MKTFLILITLAFGLLLAASQPAMAFDCSKAIKAADAYKGVVALVSRVTARQVVGDDAILYGDGVRYDFAYTYPNGYVGKTFTVMPTDSQLKILNGDKMVWIPGTKAIREMYPDENRRVPAIVGKSCKIFAIDFSTPAKEIAGI